MATRHRLIPLITSFTTPSQAMETTNIPGIVMTLPTSSPSDTAESVVLLSPTSITKSPTKLRRNTNSSSIPSAMQSFPSFSEKGAPGVGLGISYCPPNPCGSSYRTRMAAILKGARTLTYLVMGLALVIVIAVGMAPAGATAGLDLEMEFVEKVPDWLGVKELWRHREEVDAGREANVSGVGGVAEVVGENVKAQRIENDTLAGLDTLASVPVDVPRRKFRKVVGGPARLTGPHRAVSKA